MKTKFLSILFLGLPLVGSAMPNPFMTCRVESVLKDTFEEGLGVFGDQSVDSDSQEVMLPAPYMPKATRIRLGQMNFEAGTEAEIKLKADEKKMTIDLAPKAAAYRLKFRYYKNSMRGLVMISENSGKFTALAEFDCSDLATVRSTEIENRNATQLKGKTLQKLDKKIRDRIDAVDFAVEMGDGYYDVRELRYFEVRDASLKVAGYIAWARLHYTEDNEDVAAQVRFDRNGLRLGEIEKLGECEVPLKKTRKQK